MTPETKTGIPGEIIAFFLAYEPVEGKWDPERIQKALDSMSGARIEEVILGIDWDSPEGEHLLRRMADTGHLRLLPEKPFDPEEWLASGKARE